MNQDKIIINKLIKSGKVFAAINYYSHICKNLKIHHYFSDTLFLPDRFFSSHDINKYRGRIGKGKTAFLIGELFDVQKIYVVNIKEEKLRLIRFLMEMNRHGLKVKVVEAVNGKKSEKAKNGYKNFCSSSIDIAGVSNKHVPTYKRAAWKNKVSINAFGYLESQKKIFLDAKANHLKKILVLDDDIFFNPDACSILERIYAEIDNNIHILNLGVSELSDRNAKYFQKFRLFPESLVYHPVPERTNGSFAVIYDVCTYDALIQLIDENSGPFDSCALGCFYSQDFRHCFAPLESAIIPDVSQSSIRDDQSQLKIAKAMNWNIARYDEVRKKINIKIILLNPFCKINDNLRNDINFTISIECDASDFSPLFSDDYDKSSIIDFLMVVKEYAHITCEYVATALAEALKAMNNGQTDRYSTEKLFIKSFIKNQH